MQEQGAFLGMYLLQRVIQFNIRNSLPGILMNPIKVRVESIYIIIVDMVKLISIYILQVYHCMQFATNEHFNEFANLRDCSFTTLFTSK